MYLKALTVDYCVCILDLFALNIFTGYLLKEVKKADISLPQADVNPVAPLPKHIMSIMVSYLLIYNHLYHSLFSAVLY